MKKLMFVLCGSFLLSSFAPTLAHAFHGWASDAEIEAVARERRAAKEKKEREKKEKRQREEKERRKEEDKRIKKERDQRDKETDAERRKREQ
ncbi:hypothetical protein AGMMS50222_05490 [Endomicrobiia bacterium]|nr:hypothetical protein AGMMS49531_06880 [Endomicrobiia bacterium]GHT65726.1 hypothetical protein AGMMS49556_05970 [Endomicrobiia bacterium]GHT75118.1 hypothetical protein AGMMS50222_05490 [Endomicrobiia bacterium]